MASLARNGGNRREAAAVAGPGGSSGEVAAVREGDKPSAQPDESTDSDRTDVYDE